MEPLNDVISSEELRIKSNYVINEGILTLRDIIWDVWELILITFMIEFREELSFGLWRINLLDFDFSEFFE